MVVVAALVIAGLGPRVGSSEPDGLAAAGKRSVNGGLKQESKNDHLLRAVQERIVLLPNYSFRSAPNVDKPSSNKEPVVSIAGLIGSIISLGLAFGGGFLLRRRTNFAAKELN
jgi:hypothetical protein